jgi:hypothetical protein
MLGSGVLGLDRASVRPILDALDHLRQGREGVVRCLGSSGSGRSHLEEEVERDGRREQRDQGGSGSARAC